MFKERATKCRHEAEVLHIELKNFDSKHKGAHLASQHNSDISPTWTPITGEGVSKPELRLV
jgi:hypothetical protein